jgi:O-acetyl-ADP-ribose deacetylase (regulator of RNase III)
MITFKHGDILQEDVEAIVNTVNCVGVMGRGIALQFKNAYPDNFKAYEKACNASEVVPGKMFVYDRGGFINPRYIINFPTKRHWRDKSRMEDIDNGIHDLIRVIKELDIGSVAIPPLGSGLGGLDWQDVKKSITSAMNDAALDVEIIVFEPLKDQVRETKLDKVAV